MGLLMAPCRLSAGLLLSPEEDKEVSTSLPRVLPSRPVLGTFLQTLVVVLVPQQREGMVPWACRQERCCEPHAGPGGSAMPEDVVWRRAMKLVKRLEKQEL